MTRPEERSRLRPATVAVHTGLEPDPRTGAIAPPIVLTSIFRHGNPGDFEYGRTDTPAWHPLEEALSDLEGGAGAVLFASGMAAITAAVEQVPVGAHVVGSDSSYSGTRRLLRELDESGRLRATFVDITDTDAVVAALDGAALLCLETITNPLLGVCDLPACLGAARDAGVRTLVDSTFATPILVRPLEHGADIVVHSLTKYVNGHSDVLLGACIARDALTREALASRRTMTGGIAGPVEAWLALRGLRTLDVRFRRQCASALELARRLEGHPGVASVRYPGLPSHPQHERARALLDGGFGAVVGVELRAGADAAEDVGTKTRLWEHATSLGGVESTLERRARYEIDAEICPTGYLRLSVGVEDVDDLWDDLSAAIDAAAV